MDFVGISEKNKKILYWIFIALLIVAVVGFVVVGVVTSDIMNEIWSK